MPSIFMYCHDPNPMSVTVLAEKRNNVRKKNGTATVGEDSGLTRKRITRRDVKERRDAEPMRRRREVREEYAVCGTWYVVYKKKILLT